VVNIGLAGFGYWGPNLARNFNSLENCRLASVCEVRPELRERASKLYPGARLTDEFNDLLDDGGVDAIVISTPVSTHFEMARAALMSGKDVLVGKPLTRTSVEASELIDIARDGERVLMVDHTFLYTGAVRKIKEIMDTGELGEIAYIDSVRVNLGAFQQDVNVIYDLAPHDLSICCHLLDEDPVAVRAIGTTYSDRDVEYLAYIHLEYADGSIAHFHLNWLSPMKIRQTLIAGRNRMIVYDDMERSEHFIDCVEKREKPLTDGAAGLRVVRIIEAAQASIDRGGERMEMENF